MNRFYNAGVQAALEKLGSGNFLGRLLPAAREGVHELPRMAEHALNVGRKAKPSAEKLKQLNKTLAKKKYLPGSTGPY